VSTEPALVDRLREALCELDVEPAAVRADPHGATWLPAELHAWCMRDDACREELREFVAAELALARLSSAERPDPFFTARVVRALPRRFVGSRLSPQRRAVVLSASWAAAGAAAWAVLSWLTPEAAWTSAVERAHALLHVGTTAAPTAIAACVAVAVVLGVALAGGRTHTPAG
jgi:hypothetical protein